MTLTVVYRSNLLYLGSSTGNASSMPTAAMANMNRSTKSPCQDWMAKLKLQRTSPMVTPDRPDRQMLARTFNICQRRQITAYAQDRAATPNRRMKPKKGPDHPILARTCGGWRHGRVSGPAPHRLNRLCGGSVGSATRRV